MTRREAKRLTPIPFEAQQAQSDWLLEQFEKGIAPDGSYIKVGTNYPGSPNYTLAPKRETVRFPAEYRVRGSFSDHNPPRAADSFTLERFIIALPREVATATLRDLANGGPLDADDMPFEQVEIRRSSETIWHATHENNLYFVEVPYFTLRMSPSDHFITNYIATQVKGMIHANRQRTQSPSRDQD